MNPYTELDVSVDASLEEIKQRFRTLAHMHHPDKGGNEEVFKSIKLAYEILIDPIRRKQYDLTGDAIFTNLKDEAITNIVQIILHVIPLFNAEQDDLILITENRAREMLAVESNHIVNTEKSIQNFEKVLTKLRIKSDGENILQNVVANQICEQKKSLLVYQQNVHTCNLMLEILKDYEYGLRNLTFDLPTDPPVDPDYQY